ncbi:MAG: hypothetical protein K2P78_12040 [Gemmataceae bacterium]|nr:hypothetical protein [Gemmataceae bacterium]
MLVEGRPTPVGQVIKGYFPAVVKEEEWNATRQAIAERRRTGGKPSVKAINLFSGLVRMGGVKAYFKDKSGVKYLCPADHSNPGVRLDHLERAVVHLLVEVRLNLESETGIDELRREAAELDRSVRFCKHRSTPTTTCGTCSRPWPSGGGSWPT